MKSNEKILIISTGILNAYLSKFLLSKNYKVYVTSRNLKKSYKNFHKLNIEKKIIFKKLNKFNWKPKIYGRTLISNIYKSLS